MKDSRKQFIKDGHAAACQEWKTKIEKEFPKLFKETEFVVGKWHKDKYKNLINYQLEKKCFGFKKGVKWDLDTPTCYYIFDNTSEWTPATDKEVEEALIKEAKKIGFKEGVDYQTVSGRLVRNLRFNNLEFYPDSSGGYLTDGYGGSIFEVGKWATPIEKITKEEAEKLIGKTII